jgi:hypothetical protein
MVEPTSTGTDVSGRTTVLSRTTRSALERLAAPEAISVMEEMLRVASDNNNNNNNNHNSNGGSGCAAQAGLNREELLQKISASMSDDQLHAILKQQGII